jgi:signal transduction histidine kinase
MPRRLLREPHLLAHELRTPLAVLAGWYSLIETGDVSPGTENWNSGMLACREAVDRLNLVIKEACDEVSAIRAYDAAAADRVERLMRETQQAVDHSWEVLTKIRKGQTARLASITQLPAPSA